VSKKLHFFRSAVTAGVILVIPLPAFASVSILGCSIGETNITLGAILAAAAQTAGYLSQLAATMKAVRDDIAFVKDTYQTADELAHGNWQSLTQEFLNTVVNSDANLREIYRDSQQIISNQVPRGNQFRHLLSIGFEQVIAETFGPYPLGRSADWTGLTDVRALSLNKVADEQMNAWKEEHQRTKQAADDCAKGNHDVCVRAGARMQTQTTDTLAQIKAIKAERAHSEALLMAVENGDRKQKAVSAQTDIVDLVEAAGAISGSSGAQNHGLLGNQ